MKLQINNDFLEQWESIVNSVDKEFVPLDCIHKVVFRDWERRQKTINLKRLTDQGFSIDQLQDVLDQYIQENSENIKACEFIIDIKAVAELLQPETDKLLKGI